jgi:hypothetical protein
MPDKPSQDIHNETPNQGAQGTFHGPVNTGPQYHQQGQTVQRDQYNAGRDVNVTHHHHGEPPLQFARPTPPKPPDDFVPRPHEFNQLLAHLCSSDSGPVAITAALAGAGGFGKTTLARAISMPIIVKRQASQQGVACHPENEVRKFRTWPHRWPLLRYTYCQFTRECDRIGIRTPCAWCSTWTVWRSYRLPD